MASGPTPTATTATQSKDRKPCSTCDRGHLCPWAGTARCQRPQSPAAPGAAALYALRTGPSDELLL